MSASASICPGTGVNSSLTYTQVCGSSLVIGFSSRALREKPRPHHQPACQRLQPSFWQRLQRIGVSIRVYLRGANRNFTHTRVFGSSPAICSSSLVLRVRPRPQRPACQLLGPSSLHQLECSVNYKSFFTAVGKFTYTQACGCAPTTHFSSPGVRPPLRGPRCQAW